jgi:RNA polymerase sigma factor (sigma-70 family)
LDPFEKNGPELPTAKQHANGFGEEWMTLCDTRKLVQSLKDRKPGSFELLYATYGRKIYNLAFRMTGSQADAEDITQETFLQVYHKVGDFREESQLYTWMYAITKNLCYQFFKRTKKNSFVSFETLIDAALDAECPSDLKTLEKEEREGLIGQIKEGCLTGLLRCLPFYQRAAFIFHTLLHLPVRDVAEILGKSEGATKVLIYRAKRNLKEFLCKNCSLYDPTNRCHCESLLGFSLKQGWIQFQSAEKGIQVDTRQIEDEITGIRKVIVLYSQLMEPPLSEGLNHQLQELVQSQYGVIFTTNV